jgi:Terminase large subunit, T4likevirus-type, N-terminal/Terminase RNaseH-like domain
VSLTPTQRAFATSRDPYPAFVGGFGSGKTAAAIARAMALKAHFRKCDIAYYLPSFPLVEDIAMRRFPELCERKGWAFKTRGGTSPHIEFPGAGRILFRSMSTPASIVGYEVAHSICDELDTMPTELARTAWNKIIARNRQKCGMANTVGVATTPEGFGFVYERWVQKVSPGYVLFRAKTMDNAANLPDGYIENLRNSYPSNLLSAYLDGEFVNLTAGSVYPAFDRTLNGTFERIKPREPLHVGLDFNVTKMAAVVHVIREGKPLALDELTGVFDTPAMVALLKKRFAGHQISIYPDASGGNRKSQNASESDLSLLRQAQFSVCVNASNPAVKDRVLAMNKAIESRDYRVNADTCPVYVEGLEKQPYDKHGEPDKTGGLDHALDAAGYFITYRFPIVRHAMTINLRSATNG